MKLCYASTFNSNDQRTLSISPLFQLKNCKSTYFFSNIDGYLLINNDFKCHFGIKCSELYHHLLYINDCTSVGAQ